MTSPDRRPTDLMRVGDADRTVVADQLSAHFAQGRLTVAELDERLAVTWQARTRADLAVPLRDLPAADEAPSVPRPRRVPSPTARIGLAAHAAAYVVIISGLWIVWALTAGGHPWPVWPMLGWGLHLIGHRAQVQLCAKPAR
jgi:hypothetical protein